MKATLPVSALKDALKRIQFALPTTTVLPILSHILVTAENGGLHLRATNLEVSAWSKVQAEVTEEGSMAVPGKTLTDLVGSLDGSQTVKLTSKKDVLCIEATGKTNLKCLDAGEFPLAFKLNGEPAVVLSSADWKKAISQTVFAVNKDEGRPALTGVNFEAKDGQLTMVATDGFRLAIRQTQLVDPVEFSVIVPGNALRKAPFKDGVEPVGFYVIPERGVAFVAPNWGMSASIIDARFPDWRQIVPKAFKTTTRLTALPLLNAVKQAEVFAREEVHAIDLTSQDGKLVVTGKSDTGVSERMIEEVSFIDSVTVNGVFLTQAIESLGTETIRFDLNGPRQPMMLTAEGSLDARVIIMPLHNGDEKRAAAAAKVANAATEE